jgi:[ribosomal protein S18]-alanine N-acetyltransferase
MVDKLTPQDIDEVNKLGSLLNPKFKKVFHIESLNSNEHILVYKEENKILGFIHYCINYEIVDLLNIIVKEEYQNKMIGTILMDYAITSLPKTVQKIMLEVDETNYTAIKFYYSFNFEEISRRTHYYHENDAIIMERKLL